MHKDDPKLKKYGGVGKRIRELQNFRNTLAHSFIRLDQAFTARGKEIPQQQVSVKTLAGKLKVLWRIEQYINELWFSMVGPMDGGLGLISADDFADWPR